MGTWAEPERYEEMEDEELSMVWITPFPSTYLF